MNIALWIAQGLLAAMNAMAGSMKAFNYEKAREMLDYVKDIPKSLTLFIGTVEMLGALGMILPMLTRILPWLTPVAAIGFSLVQILAIFTIHIPRKEFKNLPMNVVLLALALFVAIGRWPLFA